jgi:hypothetical protein
MEQGNKLKETLCGFHDFCMCLLFVHDFETFYHMHGIHNPVLELGYRNILSLQQWSHPLFSLP